MTRTHTFTECYALLDVDPKTFRRWLDKAGIDPEHQVSKVDNRIRFLTQEQVEQLARDHGRTLHPVDSRPTEVIPASAYKLLIDRVEVLEQRARRAGDTLDELATSSEEHEATLHGLTAALDRQGDELGRQVNELARLVADVLLRNERLERQAAEQSALITGQAEQIAELQRPAKKPRAAAATANEPLPDGLVDWRTFTNRHAVRQNDVRQAITNGSLKVMKGRWMSDTGTTKEALDAAGRDRFWVLFSSHPGFRRCDDCPHSAGGEAKP